MTTKPATPLPCPFCAGEVVADRGKTKWNAGCADVDCPGFQVGFPYACKAEAIAAWNTRTPDPSLVEALEACRAWHYAEANNLGTFRQRGDLCAYSEWKTQQALAATHPAFKQGDYKPVPVMFGEGNSAEQIAKWVKELIAKEVEALSNQGGEG